MVSVDDISIKEKPREMLLIVVMRWNQNRKSKNEETELINGLIITALRYKLECH